jgi:hypothetical membrane protein
VRAPTIRRLGGAAGVVGPVAYVAAWAVLGARADGYDPVSQAISELAALGAPTAGPMNAAFAAFGALAVPFAVALARALPGDGRPAAAAAAVCGLATVGAAALPCSPGCPGPGTTATDTGHAVVATVGYLALMATPLLAGVALRRSGDPAARTAGTASIAVALLGTALMALWALGAMGQAGGAGQRAFNTLADAWWAAAGAALLRLRGGPSG